MRFDLSFIIFICQKYFPVSRVTSSIIIGKKIEMHVKTIKIKMFSNEAKLVIPLLHENSKKKPI